MRWEIIHSNMKMNNVQKDQKKENLKVNLSVQNIFQKIYDQQNEKSDKDSDEEKINTSEAISRISFYYEKVRNLMDYQEEYLHRKYAIARIIKRFILVEGVLKIDDASTMARNLLIELIRGGYLPNNEILEDKIDEIAKVLDKYLILFARLGLRDFVTIPKSGIDGDFILGMMASEIENKLENRKVSRAVISSMYDYLITIIKAPEGLLDDKGELYLQIYLSIHRNFLNYDDDMLNSLLLSFYHEKWKGPTKEEIEQIAKKMKSTVVTMKHQINHPLAKQIDKLVSAYSVYYRVLVKMITNDPVKVYKKIREDNLNFSIAVRGVYKGMYESAKRKLWNSGVNSIIYIFITKSVFVVLLEIPLIKYFGQSINAFALVVNVFFPAMLMFLIIATIKVSSKENNQRVVEGVEEIVYENKRREKPLMLKKAIKRPSTITFFFWILYILTYFFSFGLIIFSLNNFGFNWVSILIFLFFLAFVSFFSIRIRHNVRRLVVINEKEGLINFVVNFFFIPFVSVGKWLSAKFNRINVFVILMDFFLEAPFKFFLELTEQWTDYVKEKREEMF